VSPDTTYSAKIIHSTSDIDAKLWNACTNGNPFLSHEFFCALEQSGCVSEKTGWLPFHIQLQHSETSKIVGFVPLYIKSHSYGEYVFDHAWANAYTQAGGNYYPKLQSSVPFTPVTGSRLLTIPDTPISAQIALLQSLGNITRQHGFSSTHITFLEKKEADLAAKAGFLIRTDQQFHWQNHEYQNFDDFLEQLSSRKRKQIKKERKAALLSGIDIEILEGTDIKQHHWDAFFEFYLDTSTKKWGQPYLNRNFFERIGGSMANKIVLMLCKKHEHYIAGALNFKSDDTLYGRYWGCIEDHPYLHFETCYYQAIDFAIAHGLKTVEAGAQGPHKLARGYVPTLTYSAHWIENPGFREAVEHYLQHERHAVDAELEFLASKTPFKTP